MSATTVTRTAGVAGTFEVSFSQAPVGTPTITIYSDLARTVVAVPTANLTATANPNVWTAAYPATLDPGTYYLSISAVYTAGQPARVNSDDTLVLTDPNATVGAPVSLTEVKASLNKTLTVDDTEIQRLIDAAIAEYQQYVGPTSGTVTETHDGGDSSIILNHSNVASLVAATYSNGTAITLTDLDLDTRTGIVYWKHNTAGRFVYGTRNVAITYTIGSLPANHREAIIADVAGYFEATQRGPAGLPGEGFEAGYRANPLTLFPRIRALAGPVFA